MRNNAIKWLYAVPEKKKLYILALMLVQALNGGSGVLYALLLRNIVDNATAHDKARFWHYVMLTVLLPILPPSRSYSSISVTVMLPLTV